MKSSRLSENARPFLCFTAALALFLAIGVALSLSRQRALLIDQLNDHMDMEVQMLEAAIAQDTPAYNAAGIKQFLAVYALHSHDTASIRARAVNGAVLAEYSRPLPAARPFKRTYLIRPGGSPAMTIELTHDLEPLHRALVALVWKTIAASAVFAAAMVVFLWFILKKTAFIPLQNALRELNTANESLERRVDERTRDWMQVNTDLRNEIAEREAAERLLKQSEAKFKSFSEQAIVGIYLIQDDVIKYTNPRFLEIFGYGEAGLPPNTDFRNLVHPEDRPRVQERLRKRLMGGVSASNYQFLGMKKSGEPISIEVFGAVMEYEGRPAAIGTLLDITERKRADSELRREKDLTAAVLDTVGAIVLLLDREGRIIRFNKACEEVSGYRFEEVQGRSVWDFLLLTDQVEPVKDVFRRLSAGMFPNKHENYWVAKDGSKKLIAWSNTCLTDDAGAVTHVIPTGIDITDSREAADRLAASEARYRMVVENISEIIYVVSVSSDGLRERMQFVGGRVSDILGYSAVEFVGNDLFWFSLIHPEDLAGVTASTRRLVSKGSGTTRTYRVRHRDTGEYLWMEDKVVPQFGPRGTVIGYFGVARDVTRRKQAEDALKQALAIAEEEKNKSAAIVAALGDGISIQDRDFRIVYQNRCHSDMVGKHEGEFCYQAYVNREDICPGCPVAAAYSDGGVHTTERSRMTPSGRTYAEVTASPLRNASGEIIAGIELVRDITARKKAEEQVQRAYETQYIINAILRISHEGKPMEGLLLNALDIVLSSSWYVSQSKASLFLTDENGDLVLKVQRGFDTIAQYCSRVAPGKCLCGRAALTGTIQFAPHVDERHEILPPGITPHGHYCVPVNAKGKVLGVLMLSLEDGHPANDYEREFLTAVASAIAGIVQRKRMEEEREQMIVRLEGLLESVSASRREWQETFDSITDMISIHDDEYRIVKANKAFAARFGLEPCDVVNKKCYELFHGDHSPRIDCPYSKTLESNSPVTSEVTDSKSGRIFLISAFPLFSADSAARGIVHIARDITGARENETRLVMSERLAALGKMASGIAHEINNPLAAIAGCVDGLNRRISRGVYDEELFRKYLRIMKEELTRSKNITTGMLSFVRPKDYQKRMIAIHETILKSVEIIGYQRRLRRVKVVTNLCVDNPQVFGSEGELKQVLLIILTNALDAMDDRGRLSVDTAVNNGTFSLAITDTGPGIPESHLPRIFDSFFTTKSERGGTGLGLSIAARIVTAHNGRILASSTPGSGTTITIELPRS